VIGLGARFGPDQKGWPLDVTASAGSEKSSCRMTLL
jgi:hypothetical protein